MKCPICEEREAIINFHGLMICKDCETAEIEACKADKISMKNSGL